MQDGHGSLPWHGSGNAAFPSRGNHQEPEVLRSLLLQGLAVLSIHTTGVFNLPWGLSISFKNFIIFLLKLSHFYDNSDK